MAGALLWGPGLACSSASGPAAGPATVPPATAAARVLASGAGAVPRFPASETFTVDGPWDLSWTYDCTNVPAQQLFVTVYDAATHNVVRELTPVREQQQKGAGTVHEADRPGARFLVVDSPCPWTYTATATP